MKVNIDQIKEKAVPILKNAGVTRSSLFGSYVHGEEKEDSDIDMLVDLPTRYSLLDYIRLKHQIEDVLGISVDLVEYDAIKPIIRDSVLANLLPIL